VASKAQVRPATAMDTVNLVRLLKAQHAESAARLLAPFDEQRVLEYVTITVRNTTDARGCFAIVVEASGRLLGSAAIAPTILPWCGVIVMGEAWFAVVPSYRDKGVPEQLLSGIGLFLDRVGRPAIHGTNLLAPSSFDRMLAKCKNLTPGRTSYLRLPAAAKSEVA
jgi:GNAT superfamily N-acetyltransferase